MAEEKEQLKLERKGEELATYETKIKDCFKEELKNKFEIGRLLNIVKERKLYFYKDSQGNYSWRFWCEEFCGSRQTAERYIHLWFIFINFYKYRQAELDDIAIRRLDAMIPLLSSGEAKNKSEVDKMLHIARTTPSDNEFKKALIQKDMPLADVQDCIHIIDFYAVCRVCGEKRKVARSYITKPEEIEEKFK